MNDPAFQSAVSAIEASLRAAALAAETGDAARVGAELVHAALTIGVQMGAFKTRLGGGYEISVPGKTLNRLLLLLQTTAVRAYARADEVHAQQRTRFRVSDAAERQERLDRHTTPYAADDEQDEYLP